MLKNKIKKILPWWLCALLVVTGLQVTAFLVLPHGKTVFQNNPPAIGAPMVLGAYTSLRGQEGPTAASVPVKSAELDFSKVSAASFMVYDVESGTVLAEKNSTARYSIASLTKLLTALVAYKQSDLNQEYVVSSDDYVKYNPVLKLKPQDKIKGWDLFNAMLVGSANDAALALSHFTSKITGENFVDLMNRQAQSIGMEDSHFSNPLGFDSKYNYSTAADLKKLVDITQNFAAFTNLSKKTSYSFTSQLGNSYNIAATNKLVGSNKEIEAIKTGFTEDSKGAIITKITRDNHAVVFIILASQDREGDTLELRREIFDKFHWQ
jgi:serine-type D-Ala-D-Ala carboxypeptidase (penicillin-binding protein 5/6)